MTVSKRWLTLGLAQGVGGGLGKAATLSAHAFSDEGNEQAHADGAAHIGTGEGKYPTYIVVEGGLEDTGGGE